MFRSSSSEQTPLQTLLYKSLPGFIRISVIPTRNQKVETHVETIFSREIVDVYRGHWIDLLYSTFFMPYPIVYILCAIFYVLYTIFYILFYILYSDPYSTFYIIYSTFYILYFIFFILYSTFYIVHSIFYILYSTFYVL